ncbi:MAG: hypothetical protein Q9165_005220 [Trypethelium subeluteriae]
MGSLRQAILAVENAVSAQENGEEDAHGRLLDAIDNLSLAASTPMDMVARVRRQKHQTIHQFPEKSGEETVFQYAFGNTFFEHIKSNLDWKRNFDTFMSYRQSSTKWYETYPVEKELKSSSLKQDPQSVLLVDVAGGSGHDALAFRERFLTLPGRCILEDLPETLQQVNQLERPGIEMVPYDFFTPQPIKGLSPDSQAVLEKATPQTVGLVLNFIPRCAIVFLPTYPTRLV